MDKYAGLNSLIFIVLVSLFVGSAALLGWLFFRFAKSLVDSAGDILVAVVGAVGALSLALATHMLTQMRTQYLEMQREKRNNYLELLGSLKAYIAAEDTKTCMELHFQTWVIGSPSVVEASGELLRITQNHDRITGSEGPEQAAQEINNAVRKLFVAMRDDLGQGDVYGLEFNAIVPRGGFTT